MKTLAMFGIEVFGCGLGPGRRSCVTVKRQGSVSSGGAGGGGDGVSDDGVGGGRVESGDGVCAMMVEALLRLRLEGGIAGELVRVWIMRSS